MLPSKNYLDFHTHCQRHADRDNITEIVSIHPGKQPTTGFDFYTYGKHPWWTTQPLSDPEKEDIKNHLENPGCLAMGEMGLDKLKGPDLKIQETILRSQLEVAVETKMPVIIHCVRTFDQLLKIKKDYPNIQNWCIHGYARNEILAKQLTDQGFYISLMPMKPDEKYEKLLTTLPVEKFFLETDSMPDVEIENIYLQAATVLNIEVPALIAQINQNANTFFNL